MRVYQTKLGENGNCLEACVSSITGVPIENITLPCDDTWWDIFYKWLYDLGYIAILSQEDECKENELYIAVVEDDFHHAVLFRNKQLEFDPERTVKESYKPLYYIFIRGK